MNQKPPRIFNKPFENSKYFQAGKQYAPKDDEKMWDSYTLNSDEYMMKPDYSILSFLSQKTIRFASEKKLAIYSDETYIGNYAVHSIKEMEYGKITNQLCVMLFGLPKERSLNLLKRIYKRGQWTPKAIYYFVIMYKTGYNQNHEI